MICISTLAIFTVGAKSLKKLGATVIEVEDFGDSEGFYKCLVGMYFLYIYN